MNDELLVGGMDGPIGSVSINNGDYSIMTTNGLIPMTTNVLTGSNIATANIIGNITSSKQSVEDIMDEHCINRIAVDHKVSAQELIKLQEVAPDYASEIKENIAKNLARDIAKKVMFKKKFDADTDVHHFIGRVWVFTDEELKSLLSEVM